MSSFNVLEIVSPSSRFATMTPLCVSLSSLRLIHFGVRVENARPCINDGFVTPDTTLVGYAVFRRARFASSFSAQVFANSGALMTQSSSTSSMSFRRKAFSAVNRMRSAMGS